VPNDQRVQPRTPWESPKLAFEGNLHEIVLSGTAKVTALPKDPGEPGKTPG
jgi:hypothetical protein